MEGGFRVLLGGIVLIALAFSLISVWPVLTETIPRSTSNTSFNNQTPAPILPTLPQVLPPTTAVQKQSPGNPSSLSALVTPPPPPQAETPFIADWVYTTKRVTFLKEPSGDPHRALSINQAELEIMPGTRLRRVRPENGWLLVQAPSRLYGWVREADVTQRVPRIKELKWSLHPSN